ncbi:sigma-54 dependent transcriptional regulator [Deferribacter thermophilus]|uniref:sigma-54-dependent transcriptional regulator n=1 Tax=Deferribacter thermophilus TaxID=53573 RepID=UPI003C23D10A
MDNKGNILIIDDEEQILWLFQESLSDLYRVYTAKNSLEAEEWLNDEKIDVCIVDLFLENESGFDLIKKWKDKYDTKFIVLTAQDTSSNVIESMKIGAVDFIPKPFNLEEIKNKISEYIDKNTKSVKSETIEYDYQSKNKKMIEIYKLIGKVATSNINILITGETGTGKEVIAKLIHQKSNRANRPFIALNMGAIPNDLIESELFGYVKGAFTGASSDKPGKFEEANGGTIFLDEISEMDLNLQVKLLRVLQEKEVYRLGGNKPVKLDVRVIAATNKNLEEYVKAGKFREDLFYRLNVINIDLPPLRERKEDIPVLIEHFLGKYKYIKNKKLHISEDALNKLILYNWPGNIRELENVVQYLIVHSTGNVIELKNLPEKVLRNNNNGLSIRKELYNLAEKLLYCSNVNDDVTIYDEYLKIVETPLIMAALDKTGNNKSAAAKLLGINRNTLRKKIKDYNLE